VIIIAAAKNNNKQKDYPCTTVRSKETVTHYAPSSFQHRAGFQDARGMKQEVRLMFCCFRNYSEINSAFHAKKSHNSALFS